VGGDLKIVELCIETGSMERWLGQEKKYVLKDSTIYIGLTDMKTRKVIKMLI